MGIADGAPEPLPPGWAHASLPAATCACFTHRASDAAIALGLDYIYHTWLPQSGWRTAQPWVATRMQWRPNGLSPEPHTIAVPIVAASATWGAGSSGRM